MKYHKRKPRTGPKQKHADYATDDIFDACIRKGLIEKTEYGYYFTPEFFETLKIYDEE